MPTTITALPARPDTAGLTSPAANAGRTGDTWAWITQIAESDWFMYALAGLLAGLLALSIRSRYKRAKIEAAGGKADLTRTDRIITRTTGILATAVVATGAWKVFGDVLHLHPAIRLVLFFFAEAQIIAAWRRVRRHIYRHAILGPGIRTIYGIALGSALVAAFDADQGVEVLLRFFAATVAAYMIAEELAEELDIYLTANPHLQNAAKKPRGRIRWAHNAESVFVWLRLAQATDRTLEDVERQRRIARFARTAYRLQVLKEDGARKWRIRAVRWSLRRQTEAANEHLKLATDQGLLAEVRAQLALLYGVEDGTSRQAVADLKPLKPVERLAISAKPFADERPSQESSQTLLTEVRTDPLTAFAPSEPKPSQKRTHDESADEYPAAGPAENAPAKADESPVEKLNASAPAKAAKPPRTPIAAIADDGPESVRKLAAAFARKPGGTNAELAKLAKVSIGSANRHLPKIRAAANAGDSGYDSQERSQSPLITTRIELPISDPEPATAKPANGHRYTPEENHS